MQIADVLKAAEPEQRGLAGLNEQVIMAYGGKSVGKSTLGSRFENPLFFDFEDRLRNIMLPDGETRPKQLQFEDWQAVLNVTQALKGTKPSETGVKTLVIDGCHFAWNLMLRTLLDDNDVESWNDGALGYMKGRDIAVKRWGEWLADLRSLSRNGYGILFTAHETTEPFVQGAMTFDKRVPLVSGVSGGIEWGWQEMRPFVDMVMHIQHAEHDGKPIVTMRLKGTNMIEAADPTPDGRLPAETVFSYRALKRAWDGELKKPSSDAKADKSKKENG